MKGIPPEIDRLMWTVAEHESPSAADEFLARYPIYREELMRRRETVSKLKVSRPGAKPEAVAIPRFSPREPKRVAPAPRQVAVVGGLVLTALALASYTATLIFSPAPTPTPDPAPHRSPAPVATQQGPKIDAQKPPSVQDPNVRNETQEPPKNPDVPGYDKPQSLVIKKATLPDVLKLLGAQAGVKVVIAPGMESPTISVEYHDMSVMGILKDLGSKYHFTPFDQGDGSIVIYPVVDSVTPPGTGNVRRLGG